MAKDNMKHRRLQELGESDFEIVDGQPDIRGWDVRDSSNNKIGEVEELILDAQKRKVRYMVVELDDDALDLDDDREVLIPIGLAELHSDDDDVILTGITAEQLKALPEYDDDNLDEAQEARICSALGRSASGSETDFYSHDHFNESNLYRQRLLTEHTSGERRQGFELRDRQEQSGREVEGYMGSGDPGLGRDRLESTRTGIYRDEEIEEDATIPVNRNISDTNEEHIRRDHLSGGEDLTGDNIRNAQDDIDRKSRGELGGRSGL